GERGGGGTGGARGEDGCCHRVSLLGGPGGQYGPSRRRRQAVALPVLRRVAFRSSGPRAAGNSTIVNPASLATARRGGFLAPLARGQRPWGPRPERAASGGSPMAKPTVVLVHGAWADGSSWAKVIPQLQQRGIQTAAVQLPLTSFADDVAAARRAIDKAD